jgi:MinD superfamily P-loop ATPase
MKTKESTKTTNEDMQRLYDYMDKMGVSYTIDRNPSPEKIARIKAQIEKNKIILKLPQ